MTKEQFLNGEHFRLNTESTKPGTSTYKLEKTTHGDQSYISKQIRSSIDNRIIDGNHELGITSIGNSGFSGFSFVMDKMVEVEYKFEDLVLFNKNK